MKRLRTASLFAVAALALTAGCAGLTGQPANPSDLATAGKTLDESVTALAQCVTTLKTEHPELAGAIDAATSKPLEGVQSAAEAYHEAATAGVPAQSTNTLWGSVKSAMGKVIDAALPVVGHAALAALGLV